MAEDAYYGNANPDLLAQVPPWVRSICEFGCGSGGMARAVRAKERPHPLTQYVGLDISAEALARSEGVLDAAIAMDFDQAPDWASSHAWQEVMHPGAFDCLILGDVLEHLKDPWTFLRSATVLLQPKGLLLMCVPNVQHWSVFARLALGSWPTEDMGLFDRTHLRWFALDDITRLAEQAGLDVVSVVPRIFDAQNGLRFAESLRPMAAAIQADFMTLRERVLPLQYVLVAIKP